MSYIIGIIKTGQSVTLVQVPQVAHFCNCATCIALSRIFTFVAQIVVVKIYVFVYLPFIYAKYFCLSVYYLTHKVYRLLTNFSIKSNL